MNAMGMAGCKIRNGESIGRNTQKKVQEYLPADDAYHRAFKEMENEQPDIPEEEKCGRCEGEGYILEQEVQELLDLVRRLIC